MQSGASFLTFPTLRSTCQVVICSAGKGRNRSTGGRAGSEDARDSVDAGSRMAVWRRRSQHVPRYVLLRSGGACEGCSNPAPFRTSCGDPYLEPHRVRRLSDGGPDNPHWMAAICPSCHRRAHHAHDAAAFNLELGPDGGGLGGGRAKPVEGSV
jgi:hypothetical protein